jgi:circadian clock protein KaiC
LLEGNPGTGKTTIALRFLLEGAAAGEQCLYTALSETEKELRLLMGWTLDAGVKV